MRDFFDFLSRRRGWIFGVMLLIVASCALLVPRININSDMTEYLPSDSPMREGLDTLRNNFPDLDMNATYVSVMFRDSLGTVERADSLLQIKGLSGILSTRQKEDLTLYQYTVEKGTDAKAIVSLLRDTYGDKAVCETNQDSIMPDNMVVILAVAVVIVMGILFLMCSSFLEAILFIFTIALAVCINMGTNAFLPSVSMLTNTISSVLQLVLSMDYSIILMSRYRQERREDECAEQTMARALRSASSSIISSSLTTIVGLLALVFMRFRIGLDLGLVLAKGVLCSLISIYTILPALIVFFDKGIKATSKKVHLMPTDALSRFENRWRIPIMVLFFALFAGMYLLQRNTELSYASIWESEISKEFHPQNPLILVYETEEQEKVLPLMDSIQTDDKVVSALSYPSVMLRKQTAEQMPGYLRGLMAMAPGMDSLDISMLGEETLRILYYAYNHPVRDEKMSFSDIGDLADKAEAAGLLPGGFDIKAIENKLMGEAPAAENKDVTVQDVPAVIREDKVPAVHESSDSIVTASDPAVTVEDTMAVAAEPSDRLSYENCTTQMTWRQMSDFLGFEPKQSFAIYRIAGKKEGTMTPEEFLHYVHDKVMRNIMFSKFISRKNARELSEVMVKVDSVIAAGPLAEVQLAQVPTTVPAADTLESRGCVKMPGDTVAAPAAAAAAAASPVRNVETPADRLLRMAASGRKYSAGTIYDALSGIGLEIDRGTVDLMFLYYGSITGYDESWSLTVEELFSFIEDKVLSDSAFDNFINEDTRQLIPSAGEAMNEGFSQIRGNSWSAAAIVTDYDLEAGDTFDFIAGLQDKADKTFSGKHYLVGESVMYKEMKDGFRKELLFLTLLTVISIFLIVALTFRSVMIPTVLVMTVMTGVYINVWVSGLGDRTLLYLAYLIVQSILMGATIDYGILFTNYYREYRAKTDRAEALRLAYRGSIHTIMTSGLIIICAPLVMSILFTDPTISAILSSLTIGAFGTIFLILFVLPAVIAALDRFTRKR